MSIFSSIWHALTGWLTPDVPNNNGYNLEKQGTNNPIPVIYGTYKQAPCIKVLKVTSDKPGGAKNEYLHLVCVFCEGEIDSIGTIYFNGIPETQIDNQRYYVERYTGTDTQTASSTLTGDVNGWNTTAKLSGVAYAYVRLKIDKKSEWWRGEPEITADIKGKKVFDPRTSSTVFSDNAVLCFYDNFTNKRYGKGTALTKINTQSFINKANYCETTRTYTRTIYRTEYNDGGRSWLKIPVGTVNETVVENLFSCNALLDTSKKVKENLDELRKGMRAILPESNGLHRIVIEKEGTPVYAFTKDNLIGGIDISGGDLNNRYNQVIVKFRNYLTGEQDEVYYPVDTTLKNQWLTEDNNKQLLGEFTFDTINSKAEALQMATVIALRSRQQLAVKFNGMPETFVVEVGDIVSLNSTIAGFSAKPFRIEHATLNIDTGEMVFQAIEHQNTIYPWSVTALTEEYVDTSLAFPASINAPTGFIFTELTSTESIQGYFTWDDPNDVLVQGYIFELYQGLTLIYSAETTTERVDISTIKKGNYTAKVKAKNTLFVSLATTISVIITINPKGDYLQLSASSKVFFTDKSGVTTPNSITITAIHNDPTAIYTGISWTTTPATIFTDNTQTITITAADFGTKQVVNVGANLNGLTDNIDLLHITDGANGAAGPQGNQGTPGSNGQTSYFHIAYADNASGSGFSQSPAGKTYLGTYVDFIATDSTNAALYSWSLIQGSQGATGNQGIPGSNGSNGQTSYLHIAYADNASGGGFSQSPAGKTYLGTYVDFIATDSTNAALYSWSLIQGSQGATGNQGIPGSNGSNGQTSYLHIAYADNASGGGFSQSQTGKAYMGTYVDFIATDSTNPALYTWVLVKGATGNTGNTGAIGPTGPTYNATVLMDSGNKGFFGARNNWLTIASITVPVGTYHFQMSLSGTCNALNAVTAQARWLKNGATIQSSVATSTAAVVSLFYNNNATLSVATTYVIQIYVNDPNLYVEGGSASGYITAEQVV